MSIGGIILPSTIRFSIMTNSNSDTREAMEAMQVVEEIAALLKISLDKETLSLCVRLIENGVNPSTLAHVILEIQRDASRVSNTQ